MNLLPKRRLLYLITLGVLNLKVIGQNLGSDNIRDAIPYPQTLTSGVALKAAKADASWPYCIEGAAAYDCNELPSTSSTVTAHLTTNDALFSFLTLVGASGEAFLPSTAFITISSTFTTKSTIFVSQALSAPLSSSPTTQYPSAPTAPESTDSMSEASLFTMLGTPTFQTTMPQTSSTVGEGFPNTATTISEQASYFTAVSISSPPSTVSQTVSASPTTQAADAASNVSPFEPTSPHPGSDTKPTSGIAVTSPCPSKDGNQRFDTNCAIEPGVSSGQAEGADSLSTATIVGLALGVALPGILLTIFVWYCCTSRNQKKGCDLENSKGLTKHRFGSPQPKLNTQSGAKARNNKDIIVAGEPGPAIVTEDIMGNLNQVRSKRSNLTPDPANPFNTPFDSPNEAEARASQIGLALTRYSTRGSKSNKSVDEDVAKLPDTVCVGRGRNITGKSLRKNKNLVGLVSDSKKPKWLSSNGSPHHRARSVSPVAAIAGSPRKLSKYYDIHTGALLHPSPDREALKLYGLYLPKSCTDPTLTDSNGKNSLTALENEDDTDMQESNNIVRSRPLSEVFYSPNLPGAFPPDHLATTAIAVAASGSSRSPSSAAPRPPITECELLNQHVCDPNLRYKCHFSTIQLNRIAFAVKNYHDKVDEEEYQELQERKEAWARDLLKKMEEQQKGENHSEDEGEESNDGKDAEKSGNMEVA